MAAALSLPLCRDFIIHWYFFLSLHHQYSIDFFSIYALSSEFVLKLICKSNAFEFPKNKKIYIQFFMCICVEWQQSYNGYLKHMGVFLVGNMLCLYATETRTSINTHKCIVIIYEINQKRSDLVFVIAEISMRSSLISGKNRFDCRDAQHNTRKKNFF